MQFKEGVAYIVTKDTIRAFIEDVEKTPLYLVGFKNIKNDYICVKQFPELAQALNLQIEAPKNKVAQLVANIGQRI